MKSAARVGQSGRISAPDSPIIEIFDRLQKTLPDRKPFVVASRRLNYGRLFHEVPRLAALFEELMLHAGGRVVIASDDDAAVSSIFVALLRCGITAVVLDPFLSERQLRLVLDTVEPGAIFIDRSITEKLSGEIGASVHVIRISDEYSSEDGDAGLNYPASLERLEPKTDLPSHVPEGLVAYILFTSGTTSRPKGVEITHRALFHHMNTLMRQYGCDEDTRILNLFPLHHTDGLIQGVAITLVAGGCLVRPFRFAISRLPELFDSIFIYRITHFVAAPTLLSLLLSFGEDRTDVFETADFQFVISSASALNETLWRNFEEMFATTVVNVYGLTEITSVALYCGPDDATRKFGTIGKPVDCEARLVDENGKSVPIGQVGELLLRGEHLMKGYFGLADETGKVLKNGWFYTGDLARCDEEGFFQIVGRKKNLIIRGGLNINPEEVTQILQEIPNVLDAVTIGVEDETFGERVVSCVVPRPGKALKRSQIAEHFVRHASREVSPDEIIILEELPRGPAGKVIIEDMREILEKNSFQPTN